MESDMVVHTFNPRTEKAGIYVWVQGQPGLSCETIFFCIFKDILTVKICMLIYALSYQKGQKISELWMHCLFKNNAGTVACLYAKK